MIQVVPITEWSDKKARIRTNVELQPSARNGLTNPSIADCLQTRPIDIPARFVKVRGELETDDMRCIDTALKIVFDLQ